MTGHWWEHDPQSEVLEWQLPAGIHTFQIRPRKPEGMQIDYVVVTTKDFDRDTFAYEPPPYTAVVEFVLH